MLYLIDDIRRDNDCIVCGCDLHYVYIKNRLSERFPNGDYEFERVGSDFAGYTE